MITVNILDEESIENAIRYIEKREKEIKEDTQDLLNRLAEIGAETARLGYSRGESEGNKYFNVRVRKLKRSVVVTATGKDLYFLEYGAGATAGQGYDTSVLPPKTDITPASWSSTKGTGEYANSKDGYWHYKKKRYYQIVPSKGMYLGYKAVLRNLPTLARRIFSK